jgi:hypothetical protein
MRRSMSEPLLRIRNHHIPASGDPPIVDGEAGNNYIGYFENPYGEQWVFTFDRETGTAILRGGDVGWNEQFDVTDGNTGDLILGREEQLWLQACLLASQQQLAD